jgi:hypothetical protein
MMATAATPSLPKLPLTIAGRSPYDRIRVRWAGSALVVLGVVLFSQGTVGVIFGILCIALGIAVWGLTRFGARDYDWYLLPPTARWIVGPGALAGSILAFVVVGGCYYMLRFIQFLLRMF